MAPSHQRVERRLAAIMAADVAGYSPLVGSDEIGHFVFSGAPEDPGQPHRGAPRPDRQHRRRQRARRVPQRRGCRQCAVEAQERLAEANQSIPADRRLEFRIGIHVGDVVVQPDDLFGDGVNIAARLQALAAPGGICISGAVYEHAGSCRTAFPTLGRRFSRTSTSRCALICCRPAPSAPRGRQPGPRP